MEDIGAKNIEKLADCAVIDEDGSSRLLGSFWKKQMAALIFVRHFG